MTHLTALLAAWTCFFCGKTSTGSGTCTNPKCGI